MICPDMTKYLLSQQDSPDLERSRLRLVEEVHDPLTARQLDALGVGAGWRCLDVGAGGGSVTRMLAERVGATGSVLAVDVDTTLLEPLQGGRIEVLRLDFLQDPLPEGAFDLVHARLVLMHVPGRLEAIRRLAVAAKPGAWVAAIDPDFTTITVSPNSLVWDRVRSFLLDAMVSGGWDPGYGERLGGDLRAAGLSEVHVEHIRCSVPGGSLRPRLTSLTLERLRARMLTLGADDQEITEARRMLEDPARIIAAPTSCMACGRRPMGS